MATDLDSRIKELTKKEGEKDLFGCLPTTTKKLLNEDNFFEHKGQLYFIEKRNDQEPGFVVKVNKVLFSGKSEYQTHLIVNTPEEGNLMVLDNMTMVSEKSESWYHEFMSHVPLYIHPNPKKILIIGGGDGGMVREITKHNSVQDIVQCDIDELVTCLSQKYFPQLTTKLYDPRVKLVFNDAKIFLTENYDKNDVTFFDLCDPEVGPTQGMFENEMFEKTYQHLNDNGILVMQAESPIHQRGWIKDTMKELKGYFPTVACYQFPMPIYPNGVWCAILCSKKELSDNQLISPNRTINVDTKHYDFASHQAAFLALKRLWD